MKKIYKHFWSILLLAIFMPALSSAQAKLVISQVYGGGGNSGAPFNRDFVEIFNAGTVAANLTDLSLQYASATGTGNFGANSGQLVLLTGSLAPGQYYLVALASGGTTGVNLPTPDISGTINMSGSAGKVALVDGTASLGCNGGSSACDPTQLARIIDLVGYGSANFFEGSGAAPTLSNTTAAFRAGNGCTDTDNNNADFATGAPNPRNTSSPVNLCFTPEPILVISQVYGGGGNAGAPLNRDFVEIFNRGTGPTDLTGLSIQYASATGTGNFGANANQLVSLSGSLEPGQYYLVALASGANGAALPTPDKEGTINMAGASGKVVLVTGDAGLGCNGGSNPCTTEQLERIIDLVGYGSANFFEGSGAAPTLSNSTAAFRAGNGCVDTDNNNADFVSGAPAPRNTMSPTNICTQVFSIVTNSLPEGLVGAPYNVTLATSAGTNPVSFEVAAGALPPGLTLITNNGNISGTPFNSGLYNFTIRATDGTGKTATRALSILINATPVCNPSVTIAEVQGEGLTSPLVFNTVTISGIVTGRKNNGYFIQMEQGDGNPNTSDALFVFTSSAPPVFVQPGNELCVTGTVTEFVSSADPGGRTLTQLTTTTAFVTNSNKPLPQAIVLTTTDLTPEGGLDQLEKYENMRVTVPSLTVVAPTQGSTNEVQATASSNGFFYGVITSTARPFREPGIQEPLTVPTGAPATVQRWDGNPELIGVASSAQPGNTPIDVSSGDVVTNMTGPLDFIRKYWVINADGTGSPNAITNNTGAQPAPQADADELTVATYNLERFFDPFDDPGTGDPIVNPIAFDNRLNKAALGIINLMRMPDVIGFQEIENLSALQSLAYRVNQRAVDAGFDNPHYVAYLEEGNDPGGIDVGFMVKTSRVQVASVTQFGKDTRFTNPTTGNQDILNDRPPLVLKASFLNPTECQPPVPFIVISNHFRSLNGNDNILDGRVRTKRLEQAKFLGELMNTLTTENADVKLINLGDFNSFEFNDGYVDIVGTVKGTPVDASLVVLPSPVVTTPALINLVDGVNPMQRYSYVFFGSAQHLDHVMVNPNMYEHVTRFVPVHFNADYPQIFRGDFSRPERISDHDPLIAYFKFTPPPPPVCSIEAVPSNNIFTGGVATNIYLGYGPQSVSLVPTATNGTAFIYEWTGAEGLSCTTCESPVFTPTTPGVYTFTATVTNEINCSSTCEITICVTDIRVTGSNGKVFVCHSPNGNPANRRTLEVSVNAVSALLNQKVAGTLGTCGSDPCTPANFVRRPSLLKSVEMQEDGQLQVHVAPNPSAGAFTLQIRSSQTEPVQVKIVDLSGRVLNEVRNLAPNTNFRTGDNLAQGMYFAEIMQNRQKVVLKLIKTK